MVEKSESFSLEETNWYERRTGQGAAPPPIMGSTLLRKRTATSLNLGEHTKTTRRHSFDFLEKPDEKFEGGLVPKKHHWYYGYFVFSFISLIACLVTLWAEPPFGKISTLFCI